MGQHQQQCSVWGLPLRDACVVVSLANSPAACPCRLLPSSVRVCPATWSRRASITARVPSCACTKQATEQQGGGDEAVPKGQQTQALDVVGDRHVSGCGLQQPLPACFFADWKGCICWFLVCLLVSALPHTCINNAVAVLGFGKHSCSHSPLLLWRAG